MTGRPRTNGPPEGGAAAHVLPVVLLVLGVPLWCFQPASAQIDTTAAARPDTAETVIDSGQAETDPTEQTSSLDPLPVVRTPYGQPATDSLPGKLPHVSIDALLSEQPGGFLYDLGPSGWPHGWSPRGFAPHRTHLWINGLPFDDPLTGRPRFELLPPSFLTAPRVGFDPGGGAVGVHTHWRNYPPKHPVTELRYRRNSNGLHAIETAHSQKRRLDLFGQPGVLHLTFGYGGRKTNGVYEGSDLRRERRVWTRLRYQTNEWALELTDRSSRHRIGARGSVQPPGTRFVSIYALPVAATSVENPRARRRTYRNDLTARVRGPLLPGLSSPTQVAASWTSNTFDFETDFGASDTTWTSRLDGGHLFAQQSLRVGRHDLTLGARASVWRVDRTNLPRLDGPRGAAHVLLRDSIALEPTSLVLNVGGHRASGRWMPSLGASVRRTVGPVALSASLRMTGQRTAWIEEDGFASLVRPLQNGARLSDRVLAGRVGARTSAGPFDLEVEAFAHQVRDAVDLYALSPSAPGSATPDTVQARQSQTPIRRAGATVSVGWRRDARRGLYATGHATAIEFLNSGASDLHERLARTLPTAFGQARIGARFVLFQDLITDLYVRGRAWSEMNSRWFHPPTGRLVVPPLQNPIPAVPGRRVGPSGTIDVRAEAKLRDATLFFTFENVQARTQLQTGTFVVPVHPLPAQQFRFGVFWPIFN